MHGDDEMCRQRRYNLSPATNCAGATKCAVTWPTQHHSQDPPAKVILFVVSVQVLRPLRTLGKNEACDELLLCAQCTIYTI